VGGRGSAMSNFAVTKSAMKNVKERDQSVEEVMFVHPLSLRFFLKAIIGHAPECSEFEILAS
jgi:hypothetical protein